MSTATAPRRGRGRPPCCPPETIIRIDELRRAGLSYQKIAVRLNTQGVPMPDNGERWGKSSVYQVMHTHHAWQVLSQIPQPRIS